MGSRKNRVMVQQRAMVDFKAEHVAWLCSVAKVAKESPQEVFDAIMSCMAQEVEATAGSVRIVRETRCGCGRPLQLVTVLPMSKTLDEFFAMVERRAA